MAKKLNYDPNEKCTQAIVFARVSSKKQKDKGVSLDVQMETITQYCIDNGLKIVKDLSIDESSTKGERKQYHEMLDFAKSCAGKQDVFGQQLIELFILAKDAGIEKLTVNQVTVAYYRRYVEKDGCKVKTNVQIMNKLFAMAANGKYPLEKVEGEQGTYRLK